MRIFYIMFEINGRDISSIGEVHGEVLRVQGRSELVLKEVKILHGIQKGQTHRQKEVPHWSVFTGIEALFDEVFK